MDASEVGAQLEKILSSPGFAQAGRLRRFLRLVVEASLDGSAGSLKEFRIGVEVFDRGKDFDPRIDPIVRVQASRLRSKLLEYYAGEGASDPVVITIPKGTYAPDIRPRDTSGVAPSAPGTTERTRIAVLPFVNMSADADHEYFSDGLTEELINRLAGVPGLHVVARTSSFRFKGRNEDLREVGAKLNVGTILEGSVRRSVDQLRVTAQLIDVGSGYHLFSRTYQRRAADVFELQDELAQAVVDEIATGGALTAGRIPAGAQTRNLDAYNAYLKGTFTFSNRFGDLRQCVRHLRDSLALDPGYAPAWAALAHAYWLLAWYNQMPAVEAIPPLREAAARTLELDPRSAQGLSSLAVVESGFDWRWEAGEARFRRAIELQPGLAILYPFYAVVCLMPQRRLDEACATARHGLALDPFNPLYQAIAIFIFANARRYDEALRQHALAMEISPGYPPLHASLAFVRECLGRVDEAIPGYRRACELSGDAPHMLSFLGHALALAGQEDEARGLLGRLLELAEPPALDIARVHVGLRETDEALGWFEAAAERRAIHMLTLPVDPRFDGIRQHPRFQAILGRMGLRG